MFAHPSFLEAISEAFELPALVASVEGSNGWLGATPVFEKSHGPFTAAALPHVTPILSPLLRARLLETDINHHRSVLDTLAHDLASAYHQVTLQLHPSLTDMRPFSWAGWEVTPQYTYVADLRVADPIATWSKSVRYTIRSDSEHFRIEENPVLADAGIALMQASYTRKAAPFGLPGGTLATLVKRLADDGLVRVFGATASGEDDPQAVAILAYDGRTAHYWMAGSKPGPAMGVLLASVVTTLKRDGLTSLDFVGANVPSVAEFKRKYGTSLQPYFRVRLVSHPVLRILDGLRGAL